jgi:hypothetical protein
MWFDEQEQCKEEKKKLLEGLDEQWTLKFQ